VLGGLVLVGGWALVDVLQGWWLAGVLSFGTAAVVWLVIEELLVEAQEGGGKTLLGSAMFFVGFGATLVT
jgi:ZIP family zinc transporter